jgi:tetratricopeptide (TPR) repeat protein
VALLEAAVAQAPAAAPLRSARAEAVAGDASLAERTARARAEADWREALRIDPADAATRVTLAELLLATERLDDAEALLGALPERAALRPRARVARARLLLARSFPEEAEALVLGTLRSDETCAAAAMVLETAGRRDAVALQDEAVATLARCAGGAERLAEHRRQRGELAEAARLWTELARAAPARIDARTALARVRVAQGDAAAAASEFEDLARLWPRDPRLQKRLADALDLAGQPRAARAARERALALDGSDLALRRALALEDGTEVLAPLAEDGDEAIRRYREAGGRSDASASLVLDAAAVEAYADGSSTERVHQVFHVQDVKGVERWGEVEVPPGAVVLRARTRKQDGRIREAEEHGGDKRTLSASGLEPGDFLEVEWMRGRPSRGPAIPGWTADPFFFRGEDLAFFRSVYAVAAPPGLLEVDAKHMPAPPETRLPDGRISVRHEARSVPALVSEPGDPSITEFLPMMQVGAGAGLPEAALAAADAFVDRLQPSHDLQALAAEVRRPAGARVPRAGEELVRAAYDAVLARVEGTGSIVDQASHVLSRGRGSRTLVLLAVLDALGVSARLALARPFPADPAPWRFPRLDLYSAPLVRVEVEGKVFWLDPSLRWTPFGALPDSVRDAEVLVLPRPGEALRVERTPARLPDDRYEVELRIEVDGEGDATLEGFERFIGYDAAAAKVALEQADTSARRRVVEQGLSRSFRALQLESVAFEGERDSAAPLTIRFRARVIGLARKAGGRWVVDAVPYPARLGARYAPLAARETPLLLPGSEQARLRIVVRPPPGSTPGPGEPRDVESPQGRYRRTEREEGGVLLREDVVEVRRSRVAPADYPAFARFAGEVDEAQAVPMDLGAVTAP